MALVQKYGRINSYNIVAENKRERGNGPRARNFLLPKKLSYSIPMTSKIEQAIFLQSARICNVSETIYIATQFGACDGFTRGGGVLPENLGRGLRPASQNPYPIYDQNLRFSLPHL